MDKYEEAIEFLKAVEPSSYFDECAAIIEELLARVHELENPPKKTALHKSFLGRQGGWSHLNK
jgi:hypothetical protein